MKSHYKNYKYICHLHIKNNIFWAATKAIYQIFNIRFKYPKKLGQTNKTYNGV